MSLIERYLHEVGRYLPVKNRADIQAEMRSLFVDTMEARRISEDNEEQVVTLLKEFGPPEKMAASYWPESQYLIGPKLFPIFRTTVTVVATILSVVFVLTLALALWVNPYPETVFNVASEFVGGLLSTLGTMVIIFYILQQLDVRVGKQGEAWDPRKLPVIESKDAIKRGELIFEIVFSLVILAVLLAFTNSTEVISIPGAQLIENPVLERYLLLIGLSVAIGIGVNLTLLWQGFWQPVTRIIHLASDLFGLYVLAVLIGAHTAWLEPRTGGSPVGFLQNLPQGTPVDAELAQILIMQGFQIGLVIALVVTIIEIIKSAYQLVRSIRTNS